MKFALRHTRTLSLLSIVLMSILSSSELYAQFRYKIDFNFETYVRWAGSTTTVSVDLVAPPSTSGARIINYTAFNGPIETAGRLRDNILESSTRYTHFAKRVNGSVSTIPFECWFGPSLDSYLPALAGGGGRLVVYEIRPMAEVNNYSGANNQLLDCTGASLQVHNGANCAEASYGVQYQVGSSTIWRTLLAYGRRGRSFSFFRSDFVGLDLQENLRIRVQHDNPSTGSPTYSDILTYVYGACSPNVTSINTQQTSCVYNNDGGFTLNFDRALNTGETLAFELRANSPTGPIISTPTGVSFSGTSYAWPDGLASGNYYLEYQTEPTGNVLNEGPINVPAPVAVTFNASWTDVDCFGENTGSIQINASGGTGVYEYFIPQVNGSNVPFSGNSVTVPNLTAGNYNVQVFDSNNCTERQ